MTRYEISLNDGSTDKVESATYSVDDGWVFFHGEKGEPTYAYPAGRVERIAVAQNPACESITISIKSPLLTEEAVAEATKNFGRALKEHALRGAL